MVKSSSSAVDKSGAANPPKHLQLRVALCAAIEKGQFVPGQKLGTENEIARRFGVSVITVRHALRDMAEMGLITRRRGAGTYVSASRPAVQSAKAGARTLLVCAWGLKPLVVEGFNYFVAYELQRGIVNTYDGKVQLIDPQDIDRVIQSVTPVESAVIWVSPRPEGIAVMERRGIPWIGMDYAGDHLLPEPNRVTLDRFRGIYEGMSLLVRQFKHERVALITAKHGDHPDRVSGYLNSLRAFGLPYREKLVVWLQQSGNEAGGYAATMELLDRREPFTAIFVDTDIKALGAIKALRERGLRVPEDVSVLGFDDIPDIDRADLPLTTVAVPRFEMASVAVKMLQKRIETGGDVPGTVLATYLVVRQSCAPRK